VPAIYCSSASDWVFMTMMRSHHRLHLRVILFEGKIEKFKMLSSSKCLFWIMNNWLCCSLVSDISVQTWVRCLSMEKKRFIRKIKGIVHSEINFWYVLAYLKCIQDVGVFVSTVFSIVIFLGQTLFCLSVI